MSVNYIYKLNGRKMAKEIATREEYLAIRGSEEVKRLLARIRANDPDAASLKEQLPQINYSGYYPDGVLKGNRLPSRAFGFDVDDPQEFERVAELLMQDPKRYELLMLERSARQGGHAVMLREMGTTILENQVRVAMMLGCEMDTNAHDINRVYFTTSDSDEDLLFLSDELFDDHYDEAQAREEALLLEQRERYGMEILPEGAHKADKHYRPNAVKKEELTAEPAEKESAADATTEVEDNYLGIPYSAIINRWWEMYNDGQTPVKSNRDVLTFELAVHLRHICGFDRELMGRVIPCYDGFSEAQKMKCIDSALAERRTHMPKRMRELLEWLKHDNVDDATLVNAVDTVQQEDLMYYYHKLSRVAKPMGMRDSIDAVGPALTMPVVTVVTTMIGGLASEVMLEIHGRPVNLNLMAYVVGEAGSGKGSIDPIVEAWLAEKQAETDMYLQQESEFRSKKRAAKNAKSQPEEVRYPVRIVSLNNTLANLAERLANTNGLHAISYTPEADTVAQKWKQSISDFSVMMRQAYDGSRYDREAKSVDAANVHIAKLLWNVAMCGTQDALYRVVSNYTDGLLRRMAIAHTPDNTYQRLDDNPPCLTEIQQRNIQMVAHLLPLMKGTVVLPKLEQRSREWVEKVRLESIKNDDRVMARCRIRDHVTAMRMTCCIMLCAVAEKLIKNHGLAGAEKRMRDDPTLWIRVAERTQTPAMLAAYDVIADSLLENDLLYFRSKMEAAYGGNVVNEYRRKGANDSIYERLAVEFTHEQAMQQALAVKGAGVSRNMVKMMLRNWRTQGLIERTEANGYRKVGSSVSGVASVMKESSTNTK